MNSSVIHNIAPQDILTFWRDAGYDRWYGKDDAFDQQLRDRFMAVWEAAREGKLSAWQDTDDGALALVIVFDQFPRNMFRNDPRTFSTDHLAREVATKAIAEGRDQRMDKALLSFLYLPFEHSEELADQERSVALFAPLGENSLKWAEHHAEIIRKFGRFPHRNTLLGRASTDAEKAYMADGGFAG